MRKRVNWKKFTDNDYAISLVGAWEMFKQFHDDPYGENAVNSWLRRITDDAGKRDSLITEEAKKGIEKTAGHHLLQVGDLFRKWYEMLNEEQDFTYEIAKEWIIGSKNLICTISEHKLIHNIDDQIKASPDNVFEILRNYDIIVNIHK